jgi:acetyl-CoA C-acetyltransferase
VTGMDRSVILGGARTPFGKLNGALASKRAVDLGSLAIEAALARSGVPASQIENVLMGQVLQGGAGQNPARQAALIAGIDRAVPAETVNRVCGSGMRAITLADSLIRAGDFSVAIAGGMESMSQAPYLLRGARAGYRMGDGTLEDMMIGDGLTCAVAGCHMGIHGGNVAAEEGVGREEQDAWALRSHQRSLAAIDSGAFAEEIIPVELSDRKGVTIVSQDESPRRETSLEALAKLKPVFDPAHAVTAGNAPGVNDGAAALVVTSERVASKLGREPMARIVAQAVSGVEPKWVMMAPVEAVEKLLKKTGWDRDKDVDLVELNEAFAVQAMAVIRELKLDPAKVNVNGGAVAIGHPIGASGARILVTLLYEMQRRNLKRGIAALCLGGGNAVALAVER